MQASERPLNTLPLPSADVEHVRILAAVNHKMFGHAPLHIGAYRVLRQLGAGGMGEVFLARDEQLDREVAIKVLDVSDAPDMLRSEARSLARLSHPNVVQIHEFGQRHGRAYVVMEYVPGPTLREWLDDHAHDRAELMGVFRAAGRGLAAAHRAGIVHRDFKPGNVIVGEDGRVRVLDFGLALTLADAEDHEYERRVAGTPRYMAPEQLRGEGVDARSDQYGFCVALEEALWGRASGPAGRGRRRPAWLWRRIRRGLEHEPAQRWPDMDALLDALDPRPRRRRFALAGGVLGIAVAVALGTRVSGDVCRLPTSMLAASWGSQQADVLRASFEAADTRNGSQQASLLVAALDDWAGSWREVRGRTCRLRHDGELGDALALRRDECLDDQRRLIDAIVAALDQPDRQTVINTRELITELPRPRDCEDKAKLRVQIADPPPEVATEIDQLHERLARVEANRMIGHAERNFELLESMRKPVEAIGYKPLTADFLFQQSSTEYMVGSPAKARELLELARRAAYTAKDDRLAAQLAIEQSLHAVTEHADLREAEYKLGLGQDTWERIGADADARVSLAYAAGAVALERGDLDEAERQLQQALTQLDAPDTRQRWRVFVLERLANVAEVRGELERGLERRVEAVSVSVREFGPWHSRTARMRLHYAIALNRAGRVHDARAPLQQVLEAWAIDVEPSPSELARALLLSANLARSEGDNALATAYAKQTIDFVRERVPEDLETLAYAHSALASAAVDQGDFVAAVSSWEQAAGSFAAHFGEQYPLALDARIRVGVGLTDLRRFDEARVVLRAVLAATDDDALIAFARTMLADLELRDDRPTPALAWLEPLTHDFVFDDPISRLEFELLRALASLRESGEVSTRAQFDAVLAGADTDALDVLAVDLDKLAATADERQALGLSR